MQPPIGQGYPTLRHSTIRKILTRAFPEEHWSVVFDEEAFERTRAAGVPMVMDTCPKIEWARRA